MGALTAKSPAAATALIVGTTKRPKSAFTSAMPSQTDFKCKRCQAALGIIVDAGAVLVIADRVAIVSVVKLRCFSCKASTTFRPSKEEPHVSTIENILTIDPR